MMVIQLSNDIKLDERNRVYVQPCPDTGNIRVDRRLSRETIRKLKRNLFQNEGLKNIPIYVDEKIKKVIGYNIQCKNLNEIKKLVQYNRDEERFLINFNYSQKLIKMVEDCRNTYLLSFQCHSSEMDIFKDI